MTTISTGTTSTASTTSTAATTASTSTGTTSTATSGAITSSGIGSGVDTASIVAALVAAEKSPKQTQIDKQTLTTTTTLTAIEQVQTALDTYRTAVAKMNTVQTFNGLSGASSNATAASVTVDTTASTGTYALHVDKLATASKISSGVFAGKASGSVNTGTTAENLVITQSGVKTTVSVKPGMTMQQLRDSINTQTTTSGITANILTDSSGSRLVLSSTTTGAGTDITMAPEKPTTDTYTSPLDASLGSTTVITQAINASYTLDGISMSSSTNTVGGAISGVSIKLLAENTDSTISVSTSTDTLKTNVTAFMDAYNALMTTMNTLTGVTTAADGTTSGGGLTGDASIRHLVSDIRNELVKTSSSTTLSLSQLGINSNAKTGLLEMDDTKWNKAMTNASTVAAVQTLFTGTNGLLSRMTSSTASYALSNTGILATRVTSLKASLSDLTTQQETLDRRITNLTTTLTAKYNAMDTLVAQLTATSKSVLSTLDALNNSDS